MNGFTPSIQTALDELAAARQKVNQAVRRRQKVCRHLDLAECDYESGHYGSRPPMRVCCSCGMSEEGWGPSYVVLKGAAVPADRDTVYRLRHGLMVWDADKGPLLRGEVTVQQLVEETFTGERHGALA